MVGPSQLFDILRTDVESWANFGRIMAFSEAKGEVFERPTWRERNSITYPDIFGTPRLNRLRPFHGAEEGRKGKDLSGAYPAGSAAKKKDQSSLRAPCPVRYFDNTVAHNVYCLPDEERCAGTIYFI